MKAVAYSVRSDERAFFEREAERLGLEIELFEQPFSTKTVHYAVGADGISIVGTPVGRAECMALSKVGVGLLSTRTVGFDHIDLEAAREFSIEVRNVSYSPHSVAEYAIMLMLMAVRKMEMITERYRVQDFSLRNIRGRELRSCTVGVVGTGRIGRCVLELLKSFGCRTLCYDLYPAKEVEGYVDLDTLFKECDVLTFHTPLNESSYHLVNEESLNKMKPGVVLVNTARGGLIDTPALIRALEEGKVGAAALDVLESEGGLYHADHKEEVLRDHEMATLRACPNVILTPHTAFFTDQAVFDMCSISLQSIAEYASAHARKPRKKSR